MTASDLRAPWWRLFQIARSLIRQVNSKQSIIDHWTFGGGTAMMLQIEHRESRDVDIFLTDPQLLSFLDPQKWDFVFEISPNGYESDGTRFQRLVFDQIGEIDFIVAQDLTVAPTLSRDIENEAVLLETIPEIITKKIYYRGGSIKPRDIFDIAAAGEGQADAVVTALRSYRSEVMQSLAAIDRLNDDFVNRAISQLEIREPYRAVARTAVERCKEILRAV